VRKQRSFTVLDGVVAAVFVTSAALLGTADLQGHDFKRFVRPVVFQAAGPNPASIQSTVDQYRAALGAVNNGNAPGPLAEGRREINWDGGGSTATSPGPTPFTVFLNSRGANITTPGSGFVQAPLDGLVSTFGNPTYATIFQPFSPVRFFSPVGSNETEVEFFVPGGTNVPARTTGFGAVFSDVDEQEDDKRSWHRERDATVIEYVDENYDVIYRGIVPASPGDASLSFFGIVFKDAKIARVKITTGNKAPGRNDTRRLDIVMMDDFLYGEPKPQH
jgi:hypothetical protein